MWRLSRPDYFMSEATPTVPAEKPAALPAGAGAPAPAIKAILAQKIGMTRVYDAHGKSIPVTVLQAGPCPVTQVLTSEKNGYSAIQVAFGPVREKSVNKPMAGIFKKANAAPAKWIREFRTDKASLFQVGQALKVDSFAAGDYVDVFGVSKGKGFAGAMKRHKFRGGPSTHGQSDRARAPGSSGSNTYPGRVFKGKKFPGHLGVERVTIQHMEVAAHTRPPGRPCPGGPGRAGGEVAGGLLPVGDEPPPDVYRNACATGHAQRNVNIGQPVRRSHRRCRSRGARSVHCRGQPGVYSMRPSQPGIRLAA